MTKKETIAEIKRLLNIYGCFAIGEIENYDLSHPCIASMGSVVGMVEYFTEDYAEVNVYQTSSFSSDPIETYDEIYENFDENVLHEILLLCQEWEATSLKTEKRVAN